MSGSNNQIINIGLLQMECSEDFDLNLSLIIGNIKEAAKQGAQIICLQELFMWPYFCQVEDPKYFPLAEEVPGPLTEKMAGLAKDLSVVLIIPLFEKRSKGIYHNTAVVLDADGSLAGIYRKMHIPDDPYFFEKYYFTPGDTGFKSFPTRFGRIGVLICWDQWFPEAARATALAGAELLFYPTAIGWQFEEGDEIDGAQLDAWQTIQRAHAIANGIFVIAVNRVGHEALEGAEVGSGIRFWGNSFVCDPFGRVLATAPSDEEAVLVVECDLGAVERVRRDWPFLRDRRVDAYQGLTARFLDAGSAASGETASDSS